MHICVSTSISYQTLPVYRALQINEEIYEISLIIFFSNIKIKNLKQLGTEL